MLPKLFLLTIFIGILYMLFSGLYYLIHDSSDSKRTVRALTWRIALSILLFILMLVGFVSGYVPLHTL